MQWGSSRGVRQQNPIEQEAKNEGWRKMAPAVGIIAVGMLNHMHDEYEGKYRGGGREKNL